jgi:hypothetical protein
MPLFFAWSAWLPLAGGALLVILLRWYRLRKYGLESGRWGE